MNVEVLVRKGIKYYYLARSYRKFRNVRKVRIYLGRDLTRNELDNRRKGAEVKLNEKLSELKKIHDPYKAALASSELHELRKLSAKGKIKLSHLSEENWLKFTEAFTYDTNAIEGSTVEQKEVVKIIEKNEWPDKSKDEITETLGVAEAVKYIRSTKEELSIELIKELHKIVFKNSKSFAGNFRKLGEEVAVIDANRNILHRSAPSFSILSLIVELVKLYH